MRKPLTLAALALLTFAPPAFAQSTDAATAPDAAVRNGMAREGADMSEGRATKDDSTGAANAARRGTETNGNANGNNMTRNNGG